MAVPHGVKLTADYYVSNVISDSMQSATCTDGPLLTKDLELQYISIKTNDRKSRKRNASANSVFKYHILKQLQSSCHHTTKTINLITKVEAVK
jgi:hypothetical protein